MTINFNTDRAQPLKLIKKDTGAKSVGSEVSAQAKTLNGLGQPNSVNQDQQQAKANTTQQREEIRANVAELNNVSQNIQRSLKFEVDEDSGETVVTVKDKYSGEVIRQIPSEEMLSLSKRLKALNENVEATGILLKSDA